MRPRRSASMPAADTTPTSTTPRGPRCGRCSDLWHHAAVPARRAPEMGPGGADRRQSPPVQAGFAPGTCRGDRGRLPQHRDRSFRAQRHHGRPLGRAGDPPLRRRVRPAAVVRLGRHGYRRPGTFARRIRAGRGAPHPVGVCTNSTKCSNQNNIFGISIVRRMARILPCAGTAKQNAFLKIRNAMAESDTILTGLLRSSR